MKLLLQEGGDYTVEDYVSWDLQEGERYELIDGKVYAMASPSHHHQRIVSYILGEFYILLKGRDCEVLPSMDTRLFPEVDMKDKTVVQPDLLINCDKSKSKNRMIEGPPDLVIEVISPSNGSYDFLYKKKLYEKAGIKEYWIVVDETLLFVYTLKNGNYAETQYCSSLEDEILSIPISIWDKKVSITIDYKELNKMR